MSRRKKDPLRAMTEEERNWLERISRSQAEPASHVARAKQILAVAAGCSYTEAAQKSGRIAGDAVSHLVSRFNQEGMNAILPRHGGGAVVKYGVEERERILREARRKPTPAEDGTATWSLSLLRQALQKAPDGLPDISEDTIRTVLLEAGFSWQKTRSWCETGQVVRKRKRGKVIVTDPDTTPKKNLIAQAHQIGEKLGLAVWNEDEAGPYQTKPYPGCSWQPEGEPERQPHEYFRDGTAKLLTLFHPATGEVRVKGVTSSANLILHPWLKEELSAILQTLPPPNLLDAETNRKLWEMWQEGLSLPITLPLDLPPLRMLLIWDNLRGHYTTDMLLWLFEHGIMPLYTPLGGSWLNMAESIQRILFQRGLAGQHPESPDEIIASLEAVARSWNHNPTPFEWGGKRAARRQRSRQRKHALGGSGACTRRPIYRKSTLIHKWQHSCQPTH